MGGWVWVSQNILYTLPNPLGKSKCSGEIAKSIPSKEGGGGVALSKCLIYQSLHGRDSLVSGQAASYRTDWPCYQAEVCSSQVTALLSRPIVHILAPDRSLQCSGGD